MSPFAGTAAPSGYLLCNGATVSRATYSDLFTAIGTAFGEGDGESLADTCTFSDQAGEGDGDTNVSCATEVSAINNGFTADTTQFAPRLKVDGRNLIDIYFIHNHLN